MSATAVHSEQTGYISSHAWYCRLFLLLK